MDKEEQQKPLEEETAVNSSEKKVDDNNQADAEQAVEEKKEEVELTSDDKIKELEDKLTRTYAEMENQRRRFEKEKEVNNLRSGLYAWKKIAQSNLDTNLETAYHLHKSKKYIRDLEEYNNELKKLLEEKCSQDELKFIYDFANFDFDRSLRLPEEDLINQRNEQLIKELRLEIRELKDK